jgi:membrane protein DedA with SNARE-associated domain
VEHLITDIILQYGLVAIFVLMLLESACIPIPSEVTMLFGGALANASFAASLGAEGRHLNFLRQHELDRAEVWFDRHGEAAVFVSRLLPVVRTFISLPAGIAEMPFVRFSVYTFLGCLPWTFALAALGYALGSQWHLVERFLRPISIAIALLVLVAAAWWLYRRWQGQRRAAPTEPDEDRAPADR